jgi:hypothetical protein
VTNALVSFALRSIIADTAVCIGEALILIRYLLLLAVAKCFWNPISSTRTELPQKQQSFTDLEIQPFHKEKMALKHKLIISWIIIERFLL